MAAIAARYGVHAGPQCALPHLPRARPVRRVRKRSNAARAVTSKNRIFKRFITDRRSFPLRLRFPRPALVSYRSPAMVVGTGEYDSGVRWKKPQNIDALRLPG